MRGHGPGRTHQSENRKSLLLYSLTAITRRGTGGNTPPISLVQINTARGRPSQRPAGNSDAKWMKPSNPYNLKKGLDVARHASVTVMNTEPDVLLLIRARLIKAAPNGYGFCYASSLLNFAVRKHNCTDTILL